MTVALPAIVVNNLLPLGALAPAGPAPGVTGPPLGGAPAAGTAGSLAFAMQTQQQSNWCWSAVAVSVAGFYGTPNPTPQQCDLASQELSAACCPAGSNAACDVPWYLDKALQRVAHLNTWASGSAVMAVIQGEIKGDRPLGVRIAWSTGGGHFVVVSGYATPPTGDLVTVEDPIWGQSTLLLAVFQASYQGSGSWSHSYWTTP
jgi:papain like cysteine protease AvrRpt2